MKVWWMVKNKTDLLKWVYYDFIINNSGIVVPLFLIC